MDVDLSDRVAVITGAGGDIGRATAIRFAAAGASLVLVDVAQDAVDASCAAVREAFGGVAAEAVAADVRTTEDVQRYVAVATERFGRIDVLFNNAGIAGSPAPLAECPEDLFDAVMAVNVRGVFGMRYVLPLMLAAGRGSIVNTASTASFVAHPRRGPYAASKHAVLGLTKAAAAEVGGLGVRVNAVCPGPIDTGMSRTIAADLDPGDPTGAFERITTKVPAARYGLPDEVAAVVCFLASDEASYVNGAGWIVDGGFLAVDDG